MLAKSWYNCERYCSSKSSKALGAKQESSIAGQICKLWKMSHLKLSVGFWAPTKAQPWWNSLVGPGSLQLSQTSGAAGHWVVSVCVEAEPATGTNSCPQLKHRATAEAEAGKSPLSGQVLESWLQAEASGTRVLSPVSPEGTSIVPSSPWNSNALCTLKLKLEGQ